MTMTENTICQNCGLEHLQSGILMFDDGWIGEGRLFCCADCVNNYFHYTPDNPRYYVDDEVEYDVEDESNSNSICDVSDFRFEDEDFVYEEWEEYITDEETD